MQEAWPPLVPPHDLAPSATPSPPRDLCPMKQKPCGFLGMHHAYATLTTLSWALGSPPSARYLSIRASWFSAAAFRNTSRSTGSSWACGCG